jgi:hypothetical protein
MTDTDYMCPNCVTPWKCNGPHIPEPAPADTADLIAKAREREVDNAIHDFIAGSRMWMEARLREGARRGWGLSWRDGSYTDEEVMGRLRRAVGHLEAALANTDDPAEWQKRAADVANQAFMAADPQRRREKGTPMTDTTEREAADVLVTYLRSWRNIQLREPEAEAIGILIAENRLLLDVLEAAERVLEYGHIRPFADAARDDLRARIDAYKAAQHG